MTKTDTREIRRSRPGWNTVWFIGCDKHEDGTANKATADEIIKDWYPTRRQAEKAL